MSLRAVRFIFAAVLACSFSLQASAQLQLSASIRPLQLIAAAITAGVSEPSLILGAAQDSHNAALRPSGRRLLANAELVIWLGPALESSLAKVMLELNGTVITVQDLNGLELQYLGQDAAVGDGTEKLLDPHLWLNTEHARLIARALAEAASDIDGENANLYMSNLQAFEDAMAMLDSNIRQAHSVYAQAPFAVYHNALQYFEAQFGLQHTVSFSEFEGTKPGIRQILRVKTELHEQAISCLLVEPGINVSQLQNLLADLDLRYLPVDIMGNDYPLGQDSYAQLILALSNTMLECFR